MVMNYEQRTFEKVIKKRRNREMRLANPNRGKTSDKEIIYIPERVSFWTKLLRFLRIKQ